MPTVSLTQEIHKLQKNKQFLAIMVLLFVCVIFWTVVTLVTSQRSTKVEVQLTKLALPLNPTLNEAVIGEIEQKRYYSPDELANFTIYKLVLDQEHPDGRVVSIDARDVSPENIPSASDLGSGLNLSTGSATPTPLPTTPSPLQ